MEHFTYLASISKDVNNATKGGLNEIKAVWSGSISPVLLFILTAALVFFIVMAVISNRQGESPVKWIVIAILIFVAMGIVAASAGWF